MELITANQGMAEHIMVQVAMRRLALSTILAICERNHLGPADLEQLANQLAQREAIADSITGSNQ
ncbi:hypothetical protein [Pantoea sp. BAV 3049]|uniref:hypothetical protein n=1 Tax=Pantoea sp. BAV 3049 TaxID=2654188 RepID=UPI00131A8C8E|nr:hypothetical protein [Pantoea sp. BAV 3049]